MSDSLSGPGLQFHYTLIDFRDLAGSELLDSPHIEDNILAILARLQNRSTSVRQILDRVAMLDDPKRRAALAQLLILSGLRNLEHTVEEEAHKMPILNDILSHKVLGPAILQGRQEGRQDILKRQLEKRFGPLPGWAEARLSSFSTHELEDLAVRLLDAAKLEDLF